jgi:hypothetical protein
MSAGASVLIILGIFFHRRAYKPLLDEAKANRQQHENQ